MYAKKCTAEENVPFRRFKALKKWCRAMGHEQGGICNTRLGAVQALRAALRFPRWLRQLFQQLLIPLAALQQHLPWMRPPQPGRKQRSQARATTSFFKYLTKTYNL